MKLHRATELNYQEQPNPTIKSNGINLARLFSLKKIPKTKNITYVLL